MILITLLWGRRAASGTGPARLVPALWIVLGPLGQSITAACLLGAAARGVLSAPVAAGLRWSFTFPVGSCVTGTSQLALDTGAALFRGAAAAGFALLVLAWLIVAARTAASLPHGRLFRPAT